MRVALALLVGATWAALRETERLTPSLEPAAPGAFGVAQSKASPTRVVDVEALIEAAEEDAEEGDEQALATAAYFKGMQARRVARGIGATRPCRMAACRTLGKCLCSCKGCRVSCAGRR